MNQVAAACVVVGGFVVSVVFGGCATTKSPPRTTFSLDEDVVGEAGPRCGQKLQVVPGPVPASTREIVRWSLTTSAPVTMQQMEAALKSAAKKHCADGIALLQAIVDDGVSTAAVTSVSAVAWTTVELAPQNDAKIDVPPDF